MNRSRRDFLDFGVRALITAAGTRWAPAAQGGVTPEVAPEIGIDQLRKPLPVWDGVRGRAYRADVVVTMLGVPIFSRSGVGSAAAAIRESSAGGRKTVSIAFAGGSDAKRTHGLNYTGSTEEVMVEAGAGLMEAASFGYVTASSQEESFEDARRRVEGGKGYQHGSFVVVDELHQARQVRIRRALVPAGSGTNFGDLTARVRSQFAEASPAAREIPDAAVSATFLYSVLSAARSPERRVHGEYLHAGKRYQLDCEKTADPHTGAGLASKRLVTNAADVIKLSGQIHDLETRHNATFRVWMEAGNDLPARIEFSPRGYLRISLEFDASIANALA